MSDMSVLPAMSPRPINLDQNSSHVVSSSTSEAGGLRDNILSVGSSAIRPYLKGAVTPSKTWSRLNLGVKIQLDAIIEHYDCKKNVSLTAQVWNEKKSFFDSFGITLPAMCHRTGINYKALWQAVDNLRRDSLMKDTALNHRQKALLEQILPCNGERLGPAVAAELWQKNSIQLLLAGISRTMFAFHCSLNANALKSAIWRYEKSSHISPSILNNQRVLERLITLRDGRNIADSKAGLALTAAGKETTLTRYTDIITHRQQHAASKAIQQQELLSRIVDVKAYPDKKIAASSSWLANKALFKEAGISRHMLAKHCKISRSNIDKLIRTKIQASSDIPAGQQEIIRLVMNKTRCHGVISKAVAAYINSEDLMVRHKIRPFAFARIANVNIDAFYYVYYEKLRAEEQPSPNQKIALQQIMGRHKCSSDERYLSFIFIKHKEELLAEKITQAMFANFNNLPLAKLKNALFDLRNNTKEPLTQMITPKPTLSQKLYPNSRRDAWEKLDSAAKKMLEKLIGREECVGNARKSAMLWHQKKEFLQTKGIDHLAFSYRCQVQHRNFIKSVNRPFSQLISS